MSLPPPPGLKLASSKPQPPSSLPPRPPPSANVPPSLFKPAFPSASHINSAGIPSPAQNAFTAFAPRSVTSANFRTASPAQYVAPPTPSYNSPTTYPQQHEAYPSQPQYEPPSHTDSSTPQIRNPFAPPTTSVSGTGYAAQPIDPEMEAQILQWQSAYVSKDDNKSSSLSGIPRRDGATGANTAPLGNSSRLEPASPSIGPSSHSTPSNNDSTAKTVHRSGGGTTWTDSTLLEWDPAHFRLFVGNLAGEVTDESLLKAFSKYPSVQKARVVRDKRTTKSKGYGFVSFSDGDEYFAAGRDMQGKYIGSHPVLLKRSNTEVRAAPAGQGKDRHGKKGKGGVAGGNGAGGHRKVEHGGINKKQPKTKGGLRVLG